MTLTDRTILVTGATSGIGYELVLLLARAGNRIVATGRSERKVQHLREVSGVSEAYAFDLAQETGVRRLVECVSDESNAVSVLINCAAVQNTPRFTDKNFDPDSIAPEIATNFTSVALLTALMLPALRANDMRGLIINLSSGLALYPKSDAAIYCATKAAMHSLSQALRYQLASANICVHEAILPLVDTPMTEGRGRGKISARTAAKRIVQGVNAGVEEIYVGKARLLPLLARLSPALPRTIMRKM